MRSQEHGFFKMLFIDNDDYFQDFQVQFEYLTKI